MSVAPVQTRLVRVRGRVQGVGYRESCVHHATLLGVTGWVRNRGDGSVEALVQGSGDQLERMVDWLRRGPAMARVDDVRVEDVPSSPRFERFERRASE